MARAYLLGVWFIVGCAGDHREMPVKVFALPAPELSESAYEPHLAIDPEDPRRIVVAAQYGLSRNRGGRKIWTWQTDDGGATWQGAEQPLPGGAQSTVAADAVAGFSIDGEALLTFLFADSVAFKGGLAFTRSGTRDLILGPAQVVARDRLDSGGGAIDKPWLGVDRGSVSPGRGSIHLTWHENRPLPSRTVETTAMMATSRDQGRTWSRPSRLGPFFGVVPLVRASGDLTLVGTDRDGRAIVALTPEVGGSVSAIDTIATTGPGWTIDLPTATVTGDDHVVACWNEVGPADSTRLRCGRGNGRVPWQTRELTSPTGSVELPALTAASSGVWLAVYLASADTVSVALFRSADGGVSFAPDRILKSHPIRRDRICLNPAAACRRELPPTGGYFPGDYVGIAAADQRVVVAFALPDSAAGGRSTIHVAIVRP